MGKTILISSHILSELADFCTSIGIIERGKLLAAGSIQDIQQQIRSHRVLKVRLVEEDTDRAASLLRDDPAIRMVESYDHTVTAEFEGVDEDMSRLLAAAGPVGHPRAVIRRGAAFPRRSLHDDHQGDRELTSSGSPRSAPSFTRDQTGHAVSRQSRTDS